MNYEKIYHQLIERARTRILQGYGENHRIVPGCMGGTYDDPNNVVRLTGEEHFLAHELLVKIYPKNKKLVFALSRMAGRGASQQKRTNKWYGWIRRSFAKAISEANKGKKCPGRKLSESHRKNLSLAMIGKKQTKEHVEKRMAGSHTFSFEHRQNLSNALKGKKIPPDVLLRRTEAVRRNKKKKSLKS